MVIVHSSIVKFKIEWYTKQFFHHNFCLFFFTVNFWLVPHRVLISSMRYGWLVNLHFRESPDFVSLSIWSHHAYVCKHQPLLRQQGSICLRDLLCFRGRRRRKGVLCFWHTRSTAAEMLATFTKNPTILDSFLKRFLFLTKCGTWKSLFSSSGKVAIVYSDTGIHTMLDTYFDYFQLCKDSYQFCKVVRSGTVLEVKK